MFGSSNSRSTMPHGTFAVWFPVPRKRAMRGYTILFPNSFLKKKRRNMIEIGTSPKMGSVHFTTRRKRPNRLMSDANSCTRTLGKTLVQNLSEPLPKATWSLTFCAGYPCCSKKLKVCLKIRTGKSASRIVSSTAAY